MSAIKRSSAVLVALVVLHDLDHVRQGRGIGSELIGVGVVALVTSIAVLALAAREHHLAPTAAVVVGAGQVLGVTAVHVLPHWSPFSDPYPAAHADVLSWLVISAMMLVGLALCLAGMSALRRGVTV